MVNPGDDCYDEFLWVVVCLLNALGRQVFPNRIVGILSSESSNDQPLSRKRHNIFHHTIDKFSYIACFWPINFLLIIFLIFLGIISTFV